LKRRVYNDPDLTPLDQYLNYWSSMAGAVHCLIWKVQNSMAEGGRGPKVMRRKTTEVAGRRNWTMIGVMIAAHVKSSANYWKYPGMRRQGVEVEVSTVAADATVNVDDASSGRVYCMRSQEWMKTKVAVGGNWNRLAEHVHNHSKRKVLVAPADNAKSASEMKMLKTGRVEVVGREAFAVADAMAEGHTLHLRTTMAVDENAEEDAMDVHDWSYVVEEVEGRCCMMGMGRSSFPCLTRGGTLGIGRQRTWLKTVGDGTTGGGFLYHLKMMNRCNCPEDG
jgi:hypothetical protein